MKTYVLCVSKTFPKGHPKQGKRTFFKEGILNGVNGDTTKYEYQHYKIHTIRANANLWKKRIAEVAKGNAVLSLREWEGTPYRSKQIEFLKLTNEHGVGIQDVEMYYNSSHILIAYLDEDDLFGGIKIETLSSNDGLTVSEFYNWFPRTTKTPKFSRVIIHFTPFRY